MSSRPSDHILHHGYVATASIILLFLSTFFLSNFSRAALLNLPYSADQYVYQFQANTFLKKRLWNPLPPCKDFFHTAHTIQKNNKWVGKYSPGWPFILATAMSFKIPPDIVNPFLASLSLLVLFFIAKLLFSPMIAWLTIICLYLSPFFLFQSAALLSHTSCTLFILLAYLSGLLFIRKNGAHGLGLASGFFIGVALTIRLYAGLLCAIPLLWHIWKQRRNPGDMFYILLGLLPFLVLLIWYNHAITEHFFLTPFHWFNRYDTIELSWRILKTIPKLFITQTPWMNPAILCIYLILLPINFIKEELSCLFLAFGLLLLTTLIYHTEGNFYGIRYAYEGYGLCILFVIKSLFHPSSKINNITKKLLVSGLLASTVLTIYNIPGLIQRTRHEILANEEVFRLTQAQNLKNSIVLIENGGSMPPEDLTRNGIELTEDVLYAQSLENRNEELRACFPDKEFFLYNPKEKNILQKLRRFDL